MLKKMGSEVNVLKKSAAYYTTCVRREQLDFSCCFARDPMYPARQPVPMMYALLLWSPRRNKAIVRRQRYEKNGSYERRVSIESSRIIQTAGQTGTLLINKQNTTPRFPCICSSICTGVAGVRALPCQTRTAGRGGRRERMDGLEAYYRLSYLVVTTKTIPRRTTWSTVQLVAFPDRAVMRRNAIIGRARSGKKVTSYLT